MLYIICFCIILSIIYNGYIIYIYKDVPESLSETSYILSKNKLSKYWFTGYCEIISLCLLPLLLEIIPSNLMFLAFLISAGLAFSGLSPLFKSGPDKIVHYISAFISFGAFVAYLIICLNWIWLIGYIAILALLCIWKYKCYVYWAEICALLLILSKIILCII